MKYETECNPSDGFYTIPVYNKGKAKYLIKVFAPEGWIFGKEFKTFIKRCYLKFIFTRQYIG